MSDAAIEKKNLGNQALSAKDYPLAIQLYTEGIELDASNHILYSNRAAAYQDSGMFEEALADAEKVIQINPGFWKGYSRKGLALLSLGREMEALQAYQEGLQVAPNEVSLMQGVESAQQQLRSQQQSSQNMIVNMMIGQFQGDPIAKARQYPECAAFANSPEFARKVKEIQSNPNSLMEYLQDEEISTFISAGLQYGTPSDTGKISEEEMAKRRMEQREEMLRREEEERLRKKRVAQKKKEEEEKRKEADRIASMTPEQLQAEEIKNVANELFKAKDYEASIEKYREAHSIDPDNMVYLSNIGAVYFSQNRFEECIQICLEALEIGNKKFADLALKARALARIGNCYFKMEDFEKAVEYYNKSLLESGDRNVQQQVRKAEKALREKKRLEYIDPELSEQAKQEGNDFFKQQKYPEAIKSYTEAIKRNPDNVLLYSNRATAYIKLGAYREAIKDCDAALAIDPSFIKAYIKKGHAYFILEDYAQCMSIYDEAMKYEPDNEEIKAAINQTVYRINSAPRDEEKVKQNIENNPELQEILRDPAMRQVLTDLQTDRVAAQRHMQNPEIRSKIDKLIAAGVIQ